MLVAYRAEADSNGNLIKFHLVKLTVDCDEAVRRVFENIREMDYTAVRREMRAYVNLENLGVYTKEGVIEIIEAGEKIHPLEVHEGNIIAYVNDMIAYCGLRKAKYAFNVRFAGKICCVDNNGKLGDAAVGADKTFGWPNINNSGGHYIERSQNYRNIDNRVVLLCKNSINIENGWVTFGDYGESVIVPTGVIGVKARANNMEYSNRANGELLRDVYEEVIIGHGVRLNARGFQGLLIRKLVIEEGIQYLDDDALYDMRTFLLKLPDSIESMGTVRRANINRLELPKNIEVLPNKMFYGSSIDECKLPSRIKVIGDEAFAFCNWGCSMKIPDKTAIIGERAFEMKGEIRKDIVLPGSVRIVGKDAIYPNLRPIVGGNPHIVLENGALLWIARKGKRLWKLEILNNVETFLRVNLQAELLSDGTVII